jgi:hypothetical protein
MRYRLLWGVFFLVAFFVGGQVAATDSWTKEPWTSTGKVSYVAHELNDGYFNVGTDVAIMAKPGTDLHRWLGAAQGYRLRISRVEPSELHTFVR